LTQNDFSKEEIFVDKIDYYFTNVIARSSKTMAECRNLKFDSLKTGTEG
jgi:NADH-quinone oxidoreductase subunit G